MTGERQQRVNVGKMKNKELSQQTQITEAGYHRAEGKQNDRQNGGDNVGIRGKKKKKKRLKERREGGKRVGNRFLPSRPIGQDKSCQVRKLSSFNSLMSTALEEINATESITREERSRPSAHLALVIAAFSAGQARASPL